MDNTSIRIRDESPRNQLLTVREVAEFLRVGRVTVWRWCKEGVIPAYRVGHTWRVPRSELVDLLEASQLELLAPNENSLSESDDQDGNHFEVAADDQTESTPAPEIAKEKSPELPPQKELQAN